MAKRRFGASGRDDESADAALKSVVALMLPYPAGCQTKLMPDRASRSGAFSETLKNFFSAVLGLPAGPGSNLAPVIDVPSRAIEHR